MKPILHHRQKTILLAVLVLLVFIFNLYRSHARISALRAIPTPPQPSACQSNLFIIDTATTFWAQANHESTTNYPAEKDLKAWFSRGAFPRCPDGGTYSYGTLSLATSCSRHGHTVLPSGYTKPPAKPSFMERIRIALGTNSRASVNACIAEMKQLDGAAQQWAVENNRPDDAPLNPMDFVHLLKGAQFPLCPAGGKYSFTIVSNPPCCTFTAHSLP
ncbi:MAG TPA: hypothetical protein VGH19_16425 [Verrucomicrobiae bacterium]